MRRDAVNPIQSALGDWGVPWDVPLRKLAAQQGKTVHPAYEWEVIEVPQALPGLTGLIYPLHALAQRAESRFPSDYFSGQCWVADDAKLNIRRAAEYFQTRLGRAAIIRESNTLSCEWSSGPAAITLTAWPPKMQSMAFHNSAHERDPRLIQACSIQIHPGYRLPTSDQEAVWLETATSIWPYPDGVAPLAKNQRGVRPRPSTVAYAREPGKQLPGALSISGDGAALIINARELLVVPLANIRHLEVSKLMPAKGPGGSWLDVVCSDDAAPRGVSEFAIRSARGPDDLDAVAHELGSAIGKPVVIGPAYADA